MLECSCFGAQAAEAAGILKGQTSATSAPLTRWGPRPLTPEKEALV